MATMVPQFNMSRVLNDYIEQLYVPASELGRDCQRKTVPRRLGSPTGRSVRSAWPGVQLTLYQEPGTGCVTAPRWSCKCVAT